MLLGITIFYVVPFLGSPDDLPYGIAHLGSLFTGIGRSVGTLPLMFHPPVLKPDLDLTLGEVQGSCNLDPPRPAQVLVKMELLFQLQ